MVDSHRVVDAELSECVLAYIGTVPRPTKKSPEERVVERMGERGLDLLPSAKAIVHSVYAVDPPLHAFRTVAEMGDAVTTFLRERYPELTPEAVKAIANRFAYDWK